MKRRSFMKKSLLAAGSAFTGSSLIASPAQSTGKDIYELKVYQLTGGEGKDQLKKYYTKAVIPFLKKLGATAGIFYEYSLEEPPVVYILITHKSAEDYWNANQHIKTDQVFRESANEYFNLPANRPVFERYETFIMEAFDAIPHFRQPAKNRGLLELRTYESYNEDALRRKIKMFNTEELPLFEKVGLHPLFFGEIIAGRFMPALTYMLWFKDMDEREANWNKFRTSDEWNIMRVKQEYADTVSKVRKKFLVPADYSQI